MESDRARELEGQTSINDLLEEPVGAAYFQMVLPLYMQLGPGDFRRLP